jgi:hypothetical protein
MTLENSKSKVKIQGQMSEVLQVKRIKAERCTVYAPIERGLGKNHKKYRNKP